MNNNKGIRFGIFLLTVGIIWALVSMGIITWSIINALFILWPLILVVVGVNIIFRRNAIAGAITWLLFVAVLVSYTYFIEDVKYKGNTTAVNKTVSVDKRAETQKGDLKISLGGTNIKMDSNTSKMLEAEIQDPSVDYTQSSNNDSAYISFKKRTYQLFNYNKGSLNYNNSFHLNNQSEWNIDVDTGAVNGDLDLSDLDVEKLTLDTGAANFKVKLGEKALNPKIKVDAGASKIDFYVPNGAGVRVKMDGALNATNFNDSSIWEKKDGVYYSKGYEQASVKIEMDIDMGVGKLAVDFE
jgi:hypothetical protein